MKKIIVAYTPVFHAGYLELFGKHPDTERFVVFGQQIIADFDHLLRKDIRAIDPEDMVSMVRGLRLFRSVHVLNSFFIEHMLREKPDIVMPDEDESHYVAEKYFPSLPVTFDTTFLRWDKSRSLKEVPVVSEVTTTQELSQMFARQAFDESQKSSDWWRQVGAVIVKDGRIVLSGHNHHMPSPHTPYVFGDPRGLFSKGVRIDLTTAEHAEASVIAEAARRGISLLGTSIYVTTFPCPMCARLIAHAGIAECYFSEGYAVLDGESILTGAGVKIVRVVDSSNSSDV